MASDSVGGSFHPEAGTVVGSISRTDHSIGSNKVIRLRIARVGAYHIARIVPGPGYCLVHHFDIFKLCIENPVPYRPAAEFVDILAVGDRDCDDCIPVQRAGNGNASSELVEGVVFVTVLIKCLVVTGRTADVQLRSTVDTLDAVNLQGSDSR